MPSFKEHCRISELRTGKSYGKLHKWMDVFSLELGVSHRSKRHGLKHVDEVREMFGSEGVEEFLVHVIADYIDTTNKLLRVVEKMKVEKQRLKDVIDGLRKK